MAAGIGGILINTGTPDQAHPTAVRRYLAEFLSDRRVVEIPQILWQPILRGLILTTPPKKSAEAYAKIWTEHGSPLRAITTRKKESLKGRLDADVVVLDA